MDREYACIFKLTEATTGAATPRDCVAGLPLVAVPPVCGLRDPGAPYGPANDYTTQHYAKEYPTIREVELAALLGPQGVLSSLCPIHVTDSPTGDVPLFGHRPAVTALLARLKSRLSTR